jgi:hypothetical protein
MKTIISSDTPCNKNKDNYDWCCKECGSTDIMITAWVNPNTCEYIEDEDDSESYCNTCQKIVRLCTIEEYK